MCCNEKISQLRSAGKHVHIPGETTLLHTGTETAVDCFTDIGMSLPASALQQSSDSSFALFSSPATPKAVFCLKWAALSNLHMHALVEITSLWRRDTVRPGSVCSSFSFTLLPDELNVSYNLSIKLAEIALVAVLPAIHHLHGMKEQLQRQQNTDYKNLEGFISVLVSSGILVYLNWKQ